MNPNTELTEKQIYAHWAHLNEDCWRLDKNQVKSAVKVLEAFDGMVVDIIPILEEAGISTVAFAFREILSDYGNEVLEIAMDSTCKCHDNYKCVVN